MSHNTCEPYLPEDITSQLNSWLGASLGDDVSPVTTLYPMMKQIARSLFQYERGNHTLQPTALVHESFLRLLEVHDMNWQSREHFLSTAARLMRRVLVDHARRSASQKRGGDHVKLPIESISDLPLARTPDLIALNDALESLRRIDPQQVAIVELQYFGGLSFHHIGRVLGCSRSTVIRQWKVARLWLLHELKTVDSAPQTSAGPAADE